LIALPDINGGRRSGGHCAGEERWNMNREIKISIGDEQETAQQFIEAWHCTERREAPTGPEEYLYFPDLETLLGMLTPRRLALLKTLHALKPVSIRALAKELGRNYKNVHTDIQVLERLGLVTRRKDGCPQVPWNRIVAEFRLAA
jgi:predicted transcriptional regulator